MIQKCFTIGLALLLPTFLGCGDDDNGSASSNGSESDTGDEVGSGGTEMDTRDETGSGGTEAGAGNETGTGGTDGDGTDAGEDVPDADQPEPLPECPEGTECMSVGGNTYCVQVGAWLSPRCESDDDCDYGICLGPDGGHKWCVQWCEPPGGIPEKVSITGKVVEYSPLVEFEFPVTEYLTADQPAIEGAQVCVYDNIDIPCVNSRADGVFKLEGVPYINDPRLSVTKDGYQSVLRHVEGGTMRDRVVEKAIPLYTNEQFEQLAIAAGADYPEKNTGAIFTGAAKARIEGEDSPFTLSWDGGGDMILLDGFTVVLEPQSGIGPVYRDAEGAPDSSLNASSIYGQADFFNLEPGDYSLHFSHPDLDCYYPIPTTVVAGFVNTWNGGFFVPSEE